MDSDLVALVVGLTLAAAIIVVGLRRNLSETTRNGLPQFGSGAEQTATLGLYEGEERRARPLTRWQRRCLVSFYLLLALINAAPVIMSADDRVQHAGFAACWAICAVIVLRRESSHSSAGPDSSAGGP